MWQLEGDRLDHHGEYSFSNYPDVLATDCSPIHHRLLGQSRCKPCLRPGYFLLLLSDMLETCILMVGMRIHEQWWVVTPVKAIWVGIIKKKRRLKTQNNKKTTQGSPHSFIRGHFLLRFFFISSCHSKLPITVSLIRKLWFLWDWLQSIGTCGHFVKATRSWWMIISLH